MTLHAQIYQTMVKVSQRLLDVMLDDRVVKGRAEVTEEIRRVRKDIEKAMKRWKELEDAFVCS